MAGRHFFDRDPSPEFPVVRLYPEIQWRIPTSPACWVRDTGWVRSSGEEELAEVGPFNRGKSHYAEPIQPGTTTCDVCKARPSFRYDDFFGYLCTMCEITHALRYKARGINPWGGKAMA